MNVSLSRPGNRSNSNGANIEWTSLDRVEDWGNRMDRLINRNAQMTHASSPALIFKSNKKPHSRLERGWMISVLLGSASQRSLPLRYEAVRVRALLLRTGER